MKMTKKAASIFGLAATTLFCAGGFTGCVYGPPVEPEPPTVYGPPTYFDQEEDTGSVSESAPSITSDWKIESWTTKGETQYSVDGEDESNLPRFSSEDGKTFFLTITGENEYHGDLVLQDDGTYQLIHGDNPNILTAKIDGNILTITMPSGTFLTFVTKEE